MAIVAMLLHGSTELPAPLSELSPWLDYSPMPLDEVVAAYGSQQGRRLIKTHTPLDGLPITDGVFAISVLRNPIDAMRSMRRHVLNMAKAPEHDPFLADEETVIARGIDLPFEPTNVDDVSLGLLARHLRAAIEAKAEANGFVTMIHYSDMKRDLGQVVAHIAAHIEVDAPPDLLAEIVEAASLASMRAKATRFAPLAKAGHFKSPEGFFATGERGDHAQIPLSLMKQYAERMSELLSPDEANWLQDGGSDSVTA
ncbi:hypothetical protein SAMN05421539_102361 [Jannaschia seohaensis]|uniref:Sulfotransferase domain-containing protein n=2 Tax=Jannaschia seohaensis TaxID=475081 RepID=A0A2Y9BXV8_9RHOB|nr:hypothetical protein BCF38_102361 [Jannaschia seohaensis]SSA41522.1 hypothetical protein SAMN05421539_102361 [Jannaschia seohaensis]